MSCQICFDNYDHSIRLHSFCLCCINKLNEKKCPVCSKTFNKTYPNLALLDLIPESNYDKLKAESLKSFNEIKQIKNELIKKRDEKLNEILNK